MVYSANDVYLVLYKGKNSIFDKLIRIIKTPKEPELPPVPPIPREEWANPWNAGMPPSPPPMHLHDETFWAYSRKDLNTDYTHVGIYIPEENVTDPEDIDYYACREDAGVQLYTESAADVDLIKVNLRSADSVAILRFAEETKFLNGSMIADMGYPMLRKEGSMGSVEWVAYAFNLAFPERYTINKLIQFAKSSE